MNEDEKAAERDRIMDEMDVRDGSIEIPVDLSLLDEVPSVEGADAYDLPNPAAVAELREAEEIERQTAERVETVRDEQSLRIANMAQNGVAHFLVNVEGQELCGSCGEPFPCSTWNGEIEPRNLADSSGQPVANEDKARAVAELLNIDMDRAWRMVLASTSPDEL